MNKLITCICVLCSFVQISNAQLTYIGDDEINNKLNGYEAMYKTAGMVQLANKWYYITPNGNFCETDGTETGTKIIQNFGAQTFAYFVATKKYIFFTKSYKDEYVRQLYRYSPATGLVEVSNPTDNYKPFYLNNQIVPREKFMVDEIFVNYDEDALLIRQFTKNNFYIYIINDFNDNAKVNLVAKIPLENNYVTTPISVNTELETFKTDIYCNGRERPTGVYQTTMNVFERSLEDKNKYNFKANFALMNKRRYPKEKFLRTDKNIYNLIKSIDSATSKVYFNLFYFNKKNITTTKNTLSFEDGEAEAQIIEGTIYIISRGYLIKYDENKDIFYDVIFEKSATFPWQNISKNSKFLKAEYNYMYRRNNELAIYNSISKKTIAMPETLPADNRHFYTQNTTYAYATSKSFYFTKFSNGRQIFTKFTPSNNTYEPITFPEYKKEKFEAIKAILHNKNSFIFLTSYIGKKDKLVYKTFMYKELDIETTIIKQDDVIAKQPETISIDIRKFNKKLFTEQLTKILNNQDNQFEDIKGAFLKDDLGVRHKSTVNLEGFDSAQIIDFADVSYLHRYEANSFEITGKTNAIEFFNILDKEIQALVKKQNIDRIVENDGEVSKQINFIFKSGTTYNATEIKFLRLDVNSISKSKNPEEMGFTITIRIDKPSKKYTR